MKQFNSSDFFDFSNKDDIRIKGTRVGIETILEDYMNAFSPEEISLRYPSLTLEQVYATITFYLHNQNEIDRYLEAWRQHAEETWLKQQRNPSPLIRRLQALKKHRQASHSKAA
ncbi:DUF433 domain-containing protein [Desulfonatronum thioautotrophicum]|uniref:DUF433 domain-containing protein n=1 Tax=Desulfonatronum thioautotrophicum TaxID=617001 RepID=UPI0005EAF93F|nr:DUF433 domain-containing protein [Desulfonatronum thioautotrophicum]